MDQNNNYYDSTQMPGSVPAYDAAQPVQAPAFVPQTEQAPVYGAPQVAQTPVYGAPQVAQTPVYGTPQVVQTPVYGAPQVVQTPVYGVPQTAQAPVYGVTQQVVQTPVYAQPQPEYIYAQTVNGQTVYTDSAGNPVQPVFVDASGRPIQTPEPPTPEQQAKEIKRKVRVDMGRHGGILLLGQLVSSAALIIGVVIVAIVQMVGSITNPTEFSVFTQSDTFQNSFGYMLCMAIASLLGNTLVFIPFAKKRGVRPFSTFTGGEKPTGTFFWAVTLAGLGLNYLWGFIYMGLCSLFPSISNSDMGLDVNAYDLKTIIVYIILVCVIAPITEEFMFRGVLLHSLRRYGDRLAIVTTALFFGLLHGNLAQTPMAFLLGLVLGYIAVKTGSIWYSILIHFINNTYSTIITVGSMYLPKYGDIIDWVDLGIGAVLAASAIVLLIVNRKKILFPTDSEEVKSGLIRHRYGTFFSAFWNIFFIVLMLLTIAVSIFTNSMMQDLQSVDPGFISSIVRLF